MMKNIGLFFLLAVLLGSCKKTDCEPSEFATLAIHKSELYGGGNEAISAGNMVIRTEEEWTALIDKMDSVNDESSSFTTVDIDFTTQVIIACFDEVRPHGGYQLSIEDVIKNGDQIEVTVLTTNSGGLSSQVINQPYEIMAVNACDEEIVFN